MGAKASQITNLTMVYSTIYSRRSSTKTSKLRVTGLCGGNSPVTGEFPAQMASNAKKISIWWRHHGTGPYSSFNNGHKATCPFPYIYRMDFQLKYCNKMNIINSEYYALPRKAVTDIMPLQSDVTWTLNLLISQVTRMFVQVENKDIIKVMNCWSFVRVIQNKGPVMWKVCLCQYVLLFCNSGLILGLRPANERRRYFVTTSFIGWAQA